MITIISRKRHQQLVMREKLFLNPKYENPSYEELVAIHDQKLADIKDIRTRLIKMRKTFTTLIKTEGRTLKQYKKNKLK